MPGGEGGPFLPGATARGPGKASLGTSGMLDRRDIAKAEQKRPRLVMCVSHPFVTEGHASTTGKRFKRSRHRKGASEHNVEFSKLKGNGGRMHRQPLSAGGGWEGKDRGPMALHEGTRTCFNSERDKGVSRRDKLLRPRFGIVKFRAQRRWEVFRVQRKIRPSWAAFNWGLFAPGGTLRRS